MLQRRLPFTVAFALLIAVPLVAQPTVFTEDTAIHNWLILGPFPNPDVPPAQVQDGITRRGFRQDFLTALGGETEAKLTTDTTVSYTGDDGQPHEVKAVAAQATARGILDFGPAFVGHNLDHQVAYAYAEITCDQDLPAYFAFGSDDAARVWLNGQLVHDDWTPGRGLTMTPGAFQAPLKAGTNRLLVKVDNWLGAWTVGVRVQNEATFQREKAAVDQKQKLRVFQDVRIKPASGYIFSPGAFPPLAWESPATVEAAFGMVPLKTRWFDGDLNEVQKPEKPGLYAAYVEGKTRDGRLIRRALTAFCAEREYVPWADPQPLALAYPIGSGIDEQVWEQQADWLATVGGYMYYDFLSRDPRGAAMLAGLHGAKPLDRDITPLDNPRIFNQDYHLALKRKILGLEKPQRGLIAPHRRSGDPATELHEGSPAEAGVKDDLSTQLEAHCQKWYADTRVPFVLLVARHGVVVHHAAYGEDPAFGPATVDTPMEVASVTKFVFGLMLGQFVDQALIKLDDPIGKYLPDLPAEGPHAITFRQCLTHTTGLEGHRLWDGLDNPWLENVIANNVEQLEPGRALKYNGMGYDLAGKALEMISGKSIFRLMHENLFEPLGAANVNMYDLAAYLKITAYDLARLAQLTLNEGSYADLEYYSPETAKLLRPIRLGDVYPELENPETLWGIGQTYMTGPTMAVTQQDGSVKQESILSPQTLGHGSAVSAIFRVDREHDLVITMVRNATGPRYEQHATELYKIIRAGLVE